MNLSLEQLVRLLAREVFLHRKFVVGLFVVTTILVVLVGLLWPTYYVAQTTILVQDRSIIQPLMQGTAVPTSIIDRARIARQVIFGHETIRALMEDLGLARNGASPIEQQRVADALRANTTVTNVGHNLIQIQYRSEDAQRAYKVTRDLARLFIAESAASKIKESQRAFDFIDAEAKYYHTKLSDADRRLQAFRTANIDAAPGTGGDVYSRLQLLQDRIEKTREKLQQAEAGERSLREQISGEANSVVAMSREGLYLQRIAELQQRLATLRLTYHDKYPDIVSIRNQISDLKEALAAEQRRAATRHKGATSADGGMMATNPVYVRLRDNLSKAQTRVEMLKVRLADAKQQFAMEEARGKRVQGSDTTLAELTRNYKVYHGIYQSLVRRREEARISMNLDLQKEGPTFRIQNAATLPLEPTGPRFIQFMLGGISLGVALPIGLLYVAMQLRPRIRVPEIFGEHTKLPVLATVPHAWTPVALTSVRREMMRYAWAIAGTIAVVALAGVFHLLLVFYR